MTFEINAFHQPVDHLVQHWQGAKRPEKIVLSGQYCILEPLEIEKHSAALFNALWLDNQGESWTYLLSDPITSLLDFDAHLKKHLTHDDWLVYAIVDKKSRNPIGMACYLNINPEYGSIEVGYLHFSKLLKRTPLATEAMYLMMQQVFETLGYRRYEWKCNALNQASREAAKRLGFTFEGVHRQTRVVKNRNRDTAWFSMLDSEWPQQKTRLQQWLRADNFDQQGHQKKRLSNL